MKKQNIVRISDLIQKAQAFEVMPNMFVELTALNLKQIVELFWGFQDAFLGLYAEGQSQAPNYTSVIMAAPDMVAKIIAYSTNSIGQEEQLEQLPATVQLIALTEIWRLSVPDPKKLKEALSGIMAELQKVSKSLQTDSDKTTETILIPT